jgi:hypothetical protein
MKYTTIKVVDAVYERLNACRIPRPDIGEHSYETTMQVVLMDALALYEEHKMKSK